MSWEKNLLPEDAYDELAAYEEQLPYEGEPDYDFRGRPMVRPVGKPVRNVRQLSQLRQRSTTPVPIQGLADVAALSAMPTNPVQRRNGDLNLRWTVEGVPNRGQFAPVVFGGAGLITKNADPHFASLLTALTGKQVGDFAFLTTGGGAPERVRLYTGEASYLYNTDRPHIGTLLNKLSRSVLAIKRIRLQGFPPPYEDLVRNVSITLVNVNTFSKEESNTLFSSNYFAPEQFQNRVIDIELKQPIVIQPHQFILFDIPGTWAGPDIDTETGIMNISLQGCEEASLDRGTV